MAAALPLLSSGTLRHIAMCSGGDDEEPLDFLVLGGDALALFAYGAAQGAVDALLGPVASSNPELFTNEVPVDEPLSQASLIALLWIAISRVAGGYDADRTRGAPLIDALLACAVPWLGTSILLLGSLTLLGANGIGPGVTPGEADFVIGAGTVVGGWRFVASQLPPPL